MSVPGRLSRVPRQVIKKSSIKVRYCVVATIENKPPYDSSEKPVILMRGTATTRVEGYNKISDKLLSEMLRYRGR